MSKLLSVEQRNVVLQNHLAMCNAVENPVISYSTRFQLIPENVIDIDYILSKGAFFIHFGKFLLARSIAPILMRKDVNNNNVAQLVLDDPPGERAILLYVIVQNGNKQPPIEVGTILVIKCPGLISFPDGSVGLMCDSSESSLITIQPDNAILKGVEWKGLLPGQIKTSPPAAEKWKEKGNDLFKQGCFREAVDCYSKAIEEDPRNPMYYSNRSAAFISIGKSRQALEDAENGLRLDGYNKKLLLRKANALYRLKNYKECVRFIVTISVKAASAKAEDATLKQLRVKAEEAFRESTKGEYNWSAMCDEASVTSFLEHADYFDSEMVEINSLLYSGYQHALVARRAIPIGTLICASKALFFSPTNSVPTFFVNIPRIVAARLNEDPFLGRLFYKLYSGSEMGCPVETYDENDPIHLERIDKVVKLYWYGANRNIGFGFWMLPSFLNLTCVDSNCDRFTIGDFLIVRTTKNIKAGEQLMLPFYPLSASFEERDERFRLRGNVCNCRLCLMESAETPEIRAKVRAIEHELDQMEQRSANGGFASLNNASANIRQLNKLLEEARSLRPNSLDFNPLVDHIRDILSSMYWFTGKIKEAIDINKVVYAKMQQSGLLMPAIQIARTLAMQFHAIQNSFEARHWYAESEYAAKKYYGDAQLAEHKIFQPEMVPPEMVLPISQ